MMFVGAGWAILARKVLPGAVGWVGLLAGIATLLDVFTGETPLAAIGFFVYLPMFILVIVFDIWAGFLLWRNDRYPAVQARETSVA